MYSGRDKMQAWGLIVLLVSKAAGQLNAQHCGGGSGGGVSAPDDDDNSGVLRSQRVLAEVVEMIRNSHLMHNGLVNINPGLFPEPLALGDMVFGNKIALLSGDYLLANSFTRISALNNQVVSRNTLPNLTVFSLHSIRRLNRTKDLSRQKKKHVL